jgi:histone arginine demethylase JMJD6
MRRTIAMPDPRAASVVEVVHAPSAEVFRDRFDAPGRPALIRGVATAWPAFRRWTPLFFRERHGGVRVLVQPAHGSGLPRPLRLAAYVDAMLRPGRVDLYLRDWVFEQDAPELLADYTRPPYLRSLFEGVASPPPLRWIYMGPAGSATALHLDVVATSAWNALFSGTKRWLLFPPRDGPRLEPGQLYAFQPGPEGLPWPEGTRPLACVQRPGEIVFVPSGWWHQVENLTPTVSLTENFVNESNLPAVVAQLARTGDAGLRFAAALEAGAGAPRPASTG